MPLCHPARNAGLDQSAFEVLPDPVRAIEEGVVSPLQTGGRMVTDEVLDEPARLRALVVEGVGSNLVLRVALGHELLMEERGIAADEAAGDLEDLPGTAPVPLQYD